MHLICLLEGALISADFRRASAISRTKRMRDRYSIDIFEVNDWHLRAARLGWVPSGHGWFS